ncbi:hypothetical protein BT96DRAFT_485980 [Gymnopus androsaceus JB14]|uniref:Uncharacterized protein n=1 Tax=Gymnopus androsaceus JB14 TaxID=1447944 RepID=A0A6A4I307_9AGAR|nr:hypothetical protein BT96DRAFT_485980 [Gymnopus androsaceus JB14]
MADVMEVLDAAEDSGVSREILYRGEEDSLSSESSDDDSDWEDCEEEEGEIGRVDNIKTTMKDYNRRKGELRRKYRRLMQWSAARKVAWITRGTELKARKMNKTVGPAELLAEGRKEV